MIDDQGMSMKVVCRGPKKRDASETEMDESPSKKAKRGTESPGGESDDTPLTTESKAALPPPPPPPPPPAGTAAQAS